MVVDSSNKPNVVYVFDLLYVDLLLHVYQPCCHVLYCTDNRVHNAARKCPIGEDILLSLSCSGNVMFYRHIQKQLINIVAD